MTRGRGDSRTWARRVALVLLVLAGAVLAGTGCEPAPCAPIAAHADTGHGREILHGADYRPAKRPAPGSKVAPGAGTWVAPGGRVIGYAAAEDAAVYRHPGCVTRGRLEVAGMVGAVAGRDVLAGAVLLLAALVALVALEIVRRSYRAPEALEEAPEEWAPRYCHGYGRSTCTGDAYDRGETCGTCEPAPVADHGPAALLLPALVPDLEECYRIAAHEIGREDGTAAATWWECEDRDAAVHVLEMLEAGDPEAYDVLPAADLSGEWADGRRLEDVAEEALEMVAGRLEVGPALVRVVLEVAGRWPAVAGYDGTGPDGAAPVTILEDYDGAPWWVVHRVEEAHRSGGWALVAAETAADAVALLAAAGRCWPEDLEAHPLEVPARLLTLEDVAEEEYRAGHGAAVEEEVTRAARTFLPSDAAEEVREWGARSLPCLEVRADCTATGPDGRAFLSRVAEDVAEALEHGRTDPAPIGAGEDLEDVAHEIADGAVPIYTRDIFAALLETGAYRDTETLEEYGWPAPGPDGTAPTLEDGARICLYDVARRLASSLLRYAEDGS